MPALFSGEKYKDTTVGKKNSCISCGLFKDCNSPKMKPSGGFQKGIMNIGEFPNKTDDQENGYFLGKGRILKRAYAKYGIDIEEDCININALSCYPGSKLENKKLNSSIDACRKFVFAAIEKYKPRVIVLFGDAALKSVIGHRWKKDLDNIHKWRGFIIPDQQINAFICPVLSPSFVYIADEEAQTIFEQDIKRIAEETNGLFPTFVQPKIEVITDLTILNKVRGVCAFDYETTGIKPYNKEQKIYCASIADKANHVFTFKMPKTKEGRKPFRQFLKNENILKVAQNMKFEDNWSNVKLKTPVAGWAWDTQIASHQMDNRIGITSLKFQSYIRFGIIDYDSEISPHLKAKDSNSTNNLLDFVKTKENEEKVLTYCAMDSILEYRLMEYQTAQLGYDFLPF